MVLESVYRTSAFGLSSRFVGIGNFVDSVTGGIYGRSIEVTLVYSASATFLFRQFFLTLPKELSDAARIDGAGPMTFLWKILLPLSRPNLAAIAVIEFVYGWNQYLWPLLASTGPKYQTVVVGMQGMISSVAEGAVPQWNLVMAAALLAMAPPVLVMLILSPALTLVTLPLVLILTRTISRRTRVLFKEQQATPTASWSSTGAGSSSRATTRASSPRAASTRRCT